ncbi:MaoC/PaaZ C-terminal domain-containing protein [Plantactinospora sp. KLBMP9567]|uniref:MaoC/PaaZ C-terminal domain-containing protein n=1 Tax=Plantactinospora sp. KLBMP9567 TaxID=3085900 RepID=UPI002981376A|nr:MaoC/PaaZ C-terminal domain-containing protein [Plantactinospora sp. KLBMP9567]MDW5327809.1 MaoC/PaaZ C-terminal domain-containing protein [Plantactinospora sp. KLBMP9567]
MSELPNTAEGTTPAEPHGRGAAEGVPDQIGSAPEGSGVELAALPAAGPLYRRAAIGLAPGLGPARRADRLPETELLVRAVTVDREHLAAYDRVCGFRLADALPPTYPHVLAFPLALRLMSAPEFPLPLVGLVHVANRITTYRRVDAAEPLDLAVRAVDLRPHDRGRQFDMVCTASTGGEVVWRAVATYLRRERTGADGGRRDATERPAPPAPTALWRVHSRVGRDYARVSGDHNPIHTSRIAARLFGFPRPIAHGMWSKARCLAALEGRLPDAYTVDVAFKLPVPLPGTVAFSATPGWNFGLHDPSRGRPYLLGEVAASRD